MAVVMDSGSKTLLGILAILLGIFVITFPLMSVYTIDILAGVGILILGIWILIQSIEISKEGLGMALLYLILGLIGILVGIGLIGKIVAFSILVSVSLYLAGLYLLISGFLSLYSSSDRTVKGGGWLGVILGILVIITGFFTINPYFLALFIGAALIIFGVSYISKANLND